MKCSHYITGRGQEGYGYEAITYHFDTTETWHKQNRSAATLDGKPILEMMCTSFGRPGIIASKMVEGITRSWHYMETLLPYCDDKSLQDKQEWQEYLEAPGRMLYFTPIDTEAFLKMSEDNIRDLEIYQGPLPTIPDDKNLVPEMPSDMLASLLYDLWYCCCQRIDDPQNRGIGENDREKADSRWKTIRLELTDSVTARMTLETGIAFVNHVLMPALPPAVRQIISVSIGGSWDRAVDPNQHPAALQIVLPGASSASAPDEGCYYCTGQNHYYRPLLSKGFSPAMGKALLEGSSTSPALRDYNIIAASHPFEEISANIQLAQYLCYARLHLLRNEKVPSADDASKAYEYMKAAEKMIAGYLPTESESDLAFYTAQLQQDVFRALAQHIPTNIDAKQYRFYALRVFGFSQSAKPANLNQKELREQVLEAGTALLLKPESLEDEPKIPFLQYLDDEHKKKKDALIARDSSLFGALLFESLILHGRKTPVGTDTLKLLKEYCRYDEQSSAKLTRYLCILLEDDHPVDDIQQVEHDLNSGDILREITAHFQRHIPHMLADEAMQAPYLAYAKKLQETEKDAQSAKELQEQEAQALAAYVQNAAEDAYLPLETIINLFKKLNMDESDPAVDTLIRLLENRNLGNQKSITDAEMTVILDTYRYASGKEESEAYGRLLSCLKEQFSQAIPQALLGTSEDAVAESFAPWKSYMSFSKQAAEQANRHFGGALNRYVEENAHLVSNRLGEVMSAYRFISGEESEEAIRSVRAVLEARKDSVFTTEEVQLLKPVFDYITINKASEASSLFIETLKKQFNVALPTLFDPAATDASIAAVAQPWNVCIANLGDEGTEMQHHTADCCLKYVRENASRLSGSLKNIIAVFEHLNLSGTTFQTEAATIVLQQRANSSALYSQNDCALLAPVFSHCSNAPEQPETAGLVDVLLKHFSIALPSMIADETSGLAAEKSAAPWTVASKKLGSAEGLLHNGIARQLVEYTTANADSYIHRLPQLMALYKDVGLVGTEAAKNAVVAVLEKRPVDEQNQLTKPDITAIIAVAGRDARIDEAMLTRYSRSLPALLDSAQSVEKAEGATEIWRAYINGSPAVEPHMRNQFHRTVLQDAGQYDQHMHYLVNFAQAMNWKDSEELHTCLMEVLRKRNETQGFCILNEQECRLVCDLLLTKGSNRELISGLRTITGILPVIPNEPERTSMLQQDAIRYLRVLLPHMLEAMPAKEMSAWHETAMTIIRDDVIRTIGQCRDYATLRFCGSVWKKNSTFQWLKPDDIDTLDRFGTALLSEDLQTLGEQIRQEMINALQRFSLDELLKKFTTENKGWYTQLLNECVNSLLEDHSDNLLDDIHTHQDAVGLRTLLRDRMSNDRSKEPVADALAFVMDHAEKQSIAEEVSEFRRLTNPGMAVSVMKQAVLNSEQWNGLWNMSDWPQKVLYAACCHALTDKPDWDGFLNVVLPDEDIAQIRRNPITSGHSLTQIVDFVQTWFRNVNEPELADDFVSALREKRRMLYNLYQSAQAKTKAYKPIAAQRTKSATQK